MKWLFLKELVKGIGIFIIAFMIIVLGGLVYSVHFATELDCKKTMSYTVTLLNEAGKIESIEKRSVCVVYQPQ